MKVKASEAEVSVSGKASHLAQSPKGCKLTAGNPARAWVGVKAASCGFLKGRPARCGQSYQPLPALSGCLSDAGLKVICPLDGESNFVGNVSSKAKQLDKLSIVCILTGLGVPGGIFQPFH